MRGAHGRVPADQVVETELAGRGRYQQVMIEQGGEGFFRRPVLAHAAQALGAFDPTHQKFARLAVIFNNRNSYGHSTHHTIITRKEGVVNFNYMTLPAQRHIFNQVRCKPLQIRAGIGSILNYPGNFSRASAVS